MGHKERLAKYKKEIVRVFQRIKFEFETMEEALDEIEADSDIDHTADPNEESRATRAHLSGAWWRVHLLVPLLEDVMHRCDEELGNATAILEEPDRADEGWEENHSEYLEKLCAYGRAAQEAHRLFLEWRRYYKKYIAKYRCPLGPSN